MKKKYDSSLLARIIGGLLISGATVFLLCSLVTYYPFDSSLFYVHSELLPVRNMAGAFGAHCAALLFYLFGGTAFLCIILFMFITYIVMRGLLFRNEWERILFLGYAIIVSSTLLATYMIDFSWSPYPGGIVGFSCAQTLLYYGDVLGRIFFLYSSLVASLIICLRFSHVHIIRRLMRMTRGCIAAIKRYHVIDRFVAGILFVGYVMIVYPIHLLCYFMQSLYDGTAFEGTNLIIPQEEHSMTDLVFENTIDSSAINTMTYDAAATMVIEVPTIEPDDSYAETIPCAVEISSYMLPKSDIFIYETKEKNDLDLQHELQKCALILQDKLKRFGIAGEVVAIKRGPVVTLFEYQPDSDTKLSKIVSLEDDLAMALQAMSIRILAPIPGKAVVGFEVANVKRNDVLFSEIISTHAYKNFKGSLPLILGKGTTAEPVVVDLARMPHLLIAGSTGSGKSVALNALLVSLLCALNPDELKLILIDPKRLEFSAFTDIAHLLFPIVTSAHHAAPVLRWVVQEMENRYEKMAKKGARNCSDYNASLREDDLLNDNHKALPYIVVVIDELADLMLTVGRDIEDLITRITQMARAAGIHMIVATQRPSVDVITGLIKANFPSRISFRVSSRIDSRTILDTIGADKLLGRGDMLFLDASTSQLHRVHGAYVSDIEIEKVVTHIRSQRNVSYLDIHKETQESSRSISNNDDPLYEEVCLFLHEVDEISISLVQRKFRIGYNRSARIIDILESQGLIMPQDGGKMRKVIR